MLCKYLIETKTIVVAIKSVFNSNSLKMCPNDTSLPDLSELQTTSLFRNGTWILSFSSFLAVKDEGICCGCFCNDKSRVFLCNRSEIIYLSM